MSRDQRQNNKKTPEDYVRKAKSFFPNTYSELLNMEESKDLDKLINQIKKFIETYAEGITSSQLRNIYAKIKPITEVNKLKMERPKLAYIIARQQSNKKVEKANVMLHLFDDLMANVKSESDLMGFQSFMESVVAYHKYYEKINKK